MFHEKTRVCARQHLIAMHLRDKHTIMRTSDATGRSASKLLVAGSCVRHKDYTAMSGYLQSGARYTGVLATPSLPSLLPLSSAPRVLPRRCSRADNAAAAAAAATCFSRRPASTIGFCAATGRSAQPTQSTMRLHAQASQAAVVCDVEAAAPATHTSVKGAYFMPVRGRLFMARRPRPWHCALAPSASRNSLHLPAPAARALPVGKGSNHTVPFVAESEITRPFFRHTLTLFHFLLPRVCIVNALTLKALREYSLRLLLHCLAKALSELCLPPI